ncbi:unnamed protein product [Peronospora belbahrii]|uniref:Uncharacterized protein n=1 Tax=Peronospora belbahrii TaxID=622444 RepID=A0ABN8CLT5_9STRA|nr:unnamed protein product [Peronospora belbahrii]
MSLCIGMDFTSFESNTTTRWRCCGVAIVDQISKDQPFVLPATDQASCSLEIEVYGSVKRSLEKAVHIAW